MKSQFYDAPEVEEIAKQVLADPKCQDFLSVLPECRVKYLFMDGPETSKWNGICYRTTGPWAKLTSYDFVIAVFRPFWDGAFEHQKLALVFHELQHVSYIINKKGDTSFVLRDHDVELFNGEVVVYGPWRENLATLSKCFTNIPVTADTEE